MNLSEKIKIIIRSHGFDLVGFINKYDFKYFANNNPIKSNSKPVLSEPESIIVVGVCDLRWIKDTRPMLPVGKIARSYAAGHEFDLTEELHPVMRFLLSEGFQAMICTKNSPLTIFSLKAAALLAGLGWQGNNSLVINPKFGSWITFGAIATNAVLQNNNPPLPNQCGKCKKCLRACPTQAICEPFIVEPSNCLDGILNTPGIVQDNIKEKIGNRILSCDVCQEVCPYNVVPLRSQTVHGQSPCKFDLLKLIRITKVQFNAYFGNLNWSIDYKTFIRNVLIALGNSGDKRALQLMESFLFVSNEPIRDAANWAYKKLCNSL